MLIVNSVTTCKGATGSDLVAGPTYKGATGADLVAGPTYKKKSRLWPETSDKVGTSSLASYS